MTVRLKQGVIYRGRMVESGELISADLETVSIWKKNGLLIEQSEQNELELSPTSESKTPPDATGSSAQAPPGIVEGGSGSEGEMPGRDSRKKRDI